MKTSRTGAVGALLDEYERALRDLLAVIADVKAEELTTVVDRDTPDEDCRSIQSVLAHVVRSGCNYATAIRNHHGDNYPRAIAQPLPTATDYAAALEAMFRYNVETFERFPGLTLEEPNEAKKILVSWGQRYDVEQLMEHAIVHVLRHRRQVERFKALIRDQGLATLPST